MDLLPSRLSSRRFRRSDHPAARAIVRGFCRDTSLSFTPLCSRESQENPTSAPAEALREDEACVFASEISTAHRRSSIGYEQREGAPPFPEGTPGGGLVTNTQLPTARRSLETAQRFFGNEFCVAQFSGAICGFVLNSHPVIYFCKTGSVCGKE